MTKVRAFLRRVPAGPVIIALLMVGVLTLLNLYGSQGSAERAAPSEPVGIPPQLPAEDHAMPSPSATTEAPSAPPSAPAGPTGTAVPMPAPSIAAVPATTPPATATSGAGNGQGGAANPPAAPQQSPAPPQNSGGGQQNPGQDDQGNQTGSGSGQLLKVVGVLLTTDKSTGAYVRCDGRGEVIIAATIMVDGGEGDVVYQWYFDNMRSWPPDQLHFTGVGTRQLSLAIPWPTGIHFSGTHVKGTIQLRILQPAVNAQTQRINVDVVCA